MGRVWEGTDELLDRPVAIKELTINEHLPQQEIEIMRTRMLREARSAAQLSHPAIITVFDVVEKDGSPWIVMELVRGKSLSEIIKEQGTISPERAANIGFQVAAALAVAHQRGIVHRDIKPGNVLIAKGDRAVLTDFGIARLEGSSSLTRTGNLLGSPSYLAPEQARGEAAGPATDMWSLGTTLYTAIHGSPPFQRSTPMATLTAVVVDEVPPAVLAGPLRPLLEELLDKDPEGRPTVHEVAEALQQIVLEAPRESLIAPEPGVRTERTVAIAAEAVPDLSERSENTSSLPLLSAPRGERTGDGGRLKAIGLLGLAALVVGVVIVAVVLLVPPAGGADPSGAEPSTSAEEKGEDEASQAAAAPEAATPSATVSKDSGDDDDGDDDDDYDGPPLTRHEDSTGFSLEVPRGWGEERQGSSVFFRNPDGGYLQVDQTDSPGDDAKADWENQARGAGGRFSNYDLIGIENADESSLERYLTAADWEFTFTSRGRQMHAVNRGFHTKEKGYALFLVYPEDDWDTGEELLERMTKSFKPAA